MVGCSIDLGSDDAVSIVSVKKTGSNGLVDTYTITYSDGSSSTFEITNGKDGTDGINGVNGANGQNGKDGKDFDIDAIYDKYLETNPNTTYEEFLKDIFNFENVNGDLDLGTDNQTNNGNALVINKALKSSLKVYCESTEYDTETLTSDTVVHLGSAIIYKIETDYTYCITNYHVVYNKSALESSKIAKKITCYLYGSEYFPYATSNKDVNGYTVYEYGTPSLSCEYVGGSLTADIAVIRMRTDDIKAINENIEAIEFAEDYHVGETAIAIGNPKGEGISVTEGIVSVDNEMITLNIDGTSRNYRSIRIDTAIYNGSSGGGLFNASGKLIGITNAGDGQDQNVNYAVPLEIVQSAVENIMYYSARGDVSKKITLGVTVAGTNSKYVYNEETGYGEIVDEILVDEVTWGSISASIGLKKNDVITGFVINGTEYTLNRYFEIGDMLLKIRDGDTFSIKIIRNGIASETSSYKVNSSDLKQS